MNQQPDKLFREKLEGYTRPAPAAAWDKIEAGLDKKNNKGLWLKIAASLLLLVAAAYVLWRGTDHSGKIQSPVAHTAPGKTEPLKEAQDSKSTATENNLPTTRATEEKKETPRVIQTEKKKDLIQRKTKPVNLQETTVAQTETHHADETLKEEVLSEAIDIQQEPSAIVAEHNTSVVVEQEKSITLVFTAAEANEYLDKKALAEATSDDKKPSTLKKLLKKASELKNNQDPFGELRQKKNEILALNFKSGKQRGQNK